MLLMIIPAGIGQFTNIAIEVYAQSSSSCDRIVVSLVDCSSPTSSSPSSDDSIASHENDEKDNNDGDNDNDNSGDQKQDKKSGDIESKIPSTAGGGVPFP
jgi:hypothetical protein